MTNSLGDSIDRIIRLPSVLALTGLGRSSLYAMQRQGGFPSARRLSPSRSVGWLESEVRAWIASRSPRVMQ
ncbi:helix-turn-helix transcriptional regulator [Roseateles sp. LKC17W]|uniref:Helix-turn-helix transcriptional regulator n=1 Tax=Pelomonas margarita TaxID=3299031 RepID=A0ABW7FMH3_9BURK